MWVLQGEQSVNQQHQFVVANRRPTNSLCFLQRRWQTSMSFKHALFISFLAINVTDRIQIINCTFIVCLKMNDLWIKKIVNEGKQTLSDLYCSSRYRGAKKKTFKAIFVRQDIPVYLVYKTNIRVTKSMWLYFKSTLCIAWCTQNLKLLPI